MPISQKYESIFVHIPRCGGTSVEYMFEDMRTEKNLYKLGKSDTLAREILECEFSNYDYKKCVIKSPQHFTIQEIKKIVSNEIFRTYTKFAIVRNPYDKILSEYKYSSKPNVLSFEEFLVYIMSLNELERTWLFDGHLEPQYKFLINENGTFDDINKIYKLEELEVWKSELFSMCNKTEMLHKNKSLNKESRDQIYTEITEKIVYYMYEKDFNYFNYERMKL